MIYIGTSGFSYDDWKGRFYPEKIAKKDMLAYYARQFNTVEIHATYYAIPGAASFASMDRNTPDDFQFVVKAHKDMTHAKDAKPETFDAFLGAIRPLVDSGKLGCVLAQYPWSFKRTPENENRLREFKDRVGDLPTVAEFRNVEWVNDETFELLRSLGLGFCSVDEPRLKGLMPPVAEATYASTAATRRSGGITNNLTSVTITSIPKTSSPNGCRRSKALIQAPTRRICSSTTTFRASLPATRRCSRGCSICLYR
jgi:uncharacterized protein YecE (DUF72 family)